MMFKTVLLFNFLLVFCSGLYQFVQLGNNTLLLNVEHNQRSIYYCNEETNECLDPESWNTIDILEENTFYSSSDFLNIYKNIHMENNKIKGCILYAGDLDGLGYNYQIEQARLKIIEDFKYPLDYIPNVNDNNVQQILANLSLNGYNYIIGTSSNHQSLYLYYSNYTKITFLMIQLDWMMGTLNHSDSTLINFYSFNYFWQIRYISGLFGALYTKSNETCFIAPFAFPAFVEIVNYYYLGLNEVNPSIKLYVYTVNSFSNSTLEKYAVKKCLEDHPNVDLIAYHTDDFTVLQEAARYGIKAIAYTINGRLLFGENIIASIQINWYNIFYDFFKRVKNEIDSNLTILKNREITYYTIQNDGYLLNSFSKIVEQKDITFINQITYQIANKDHEINCTNSIWLLCQRLGGCSGNGTCLTHPVTVWLNNSNMIIEPDVFIPGKAISYIYIDTSKTWVASLFLVLNVLLIIYCIVPILYMIISLIKNTKDSILSNIDFLILSYMGAILLVGGSLSIFGSPQVWNCQLQIALLSIGFDIFYLPFFAQILRIYLLKKFSTNSIDFTISKFSVYSCIFGALLFEIIYLIIWFNLAKPEIAFIPISNTTLEESYYVDCTFNNDSTNTGFLLVSVILKTIVAFVGLLLSDQVSTIGQKMVGWTKEKKEKFKRLTNASELKMTIVLTFIILDIMFICLLVLSTNVITKFVLITITIYVFIISCTLSIVISLFGKKGQPGKSEGTTVKTIESMG